MVLCKNEFHIPLKRGISHRFDTPLAILQVEVDRCSTKLIMVRVGNKEKPWSPFYLSYNGDFRVRGQPWGKLQVIRVSTRFAKVLMLSLITTGRYPLEAFVPQYQVSQNGPSKTQVPYSTQTLNFS